MGAPLDKIMPINNILHTLVLLDYDCNNWNQRKFVIKLTFKLRKLLFKQAVWPTCMFILQNSIIIVMNKLIKQVCCVWTFFSTFCTYTKNNYLKIDKIVGDSQLTVQKLMLPGPGSK